MSSANDVTREFESADPRAETPLPGGQSQMAGSQQDRTVTQGSFPEPPNRSVIMWRSKDRSGYGVLVRDDRMAMEADRLPGYHWWAGEQTFCWDELLMIVEQHGPPEHVLKLDR